MKIKNHFDEHKKLIQYQGLDNKGKKTLKTNYGEIKSGKPTTNPISANNNMNIKKTNPFNDANYRNERNKINDFNQIKNIEKNQNNISAIKV
jgi:hypothetical protein